MGVRVNATTGYKPATDARRFKKLNALVVVSIQPFCVQRSPDSHARNTEVDRSSSFTSAWTSLYNANNVTIFLRISLFLTFNMAIWIRRKFPLFAHKPGGTQVERGFACEDIIAVILRQHQWPYSFKTAHKMHIGTFFI